MKKVIYGAMGLALLFASSCKKDNVSAEKGKTAFGTEKPLIQIPGAVLDTLIGDITVNTTVNEDALLQGIVFVKPGVTLTINPGRTIFGSTGGATPDLVNLANNKGTLIVEKGAKLVAAGTSTQPIIWTSVSATKCYGDWGGVVLCGNAPIAASVGGVLVGSNTFEAFTAIPNPSRVSYGGTAANDNSGVITYNRFEYGGGVVAAAGREVNGLTLCGVGDATTLDYIEVTNSGDDAFEFFGGTVNAKHLISYDNKDDDFDFDEGYKGKLEFIVGYRINLADNSGSHLIETDGNAADLNPGTTFPRTQPIISHASLVGPGSLTGVRGLPGTSFFDNAAIQIRRNSSIILANSLITENAFPNSIAVSPTSSVLVAANTTTFPDDKIYVGVNQFNKALFINSTTAGNPIVSAGVLSLPIQGPGATSFPFDVVATGGFNLNSVYPFFSTSTTQGSGVLSSWNLGSGWVSTPSSTCP